jgi:cell division protein FtsL
MNRRGNAVLLILIAVVIVAAGLLYLARKNRQVMLTETNPTYKVTNDTSNSSLDKDMNAVDASLKNSTDAQTGVNQGINDTPIAQP